ncbi:MAG: serine protease [Candidatus Omnitrophica bacterium]|nr:serine protease [Candidatus Omnitrophota bacterium]
MKIISFKFYWILLAFSLACLGPLLSFSLFYASLAQDYLLCRRLRALPSLILTSQEKSGSLIEEIDLMGILYRLLIVNESKVFEEIKPDVERIITDFNKKQTRFHIELEESAPVLSKEFTLLWLKINGCSIGVYNNRDFVPTENNYGDIIYSYIIRSYNGKELWKENKFGVLAKKGDDRFVKMLEGFSPQPPYFLQYYGQKQENEGRIHIDRINEYLQFLSSKQIRISPIFNTPDFVNSIIKIYPFGRDEPYNATGFIVGVDSEYFYGVTAGHVVNIRDEKGKLIDEYDIEIGRSKKGAKAYILRRSSQPHEMALFKIPKSLVPKSIVINPLNLKSLNNNNGAIVFGFSQRFIDLPFNLMFTLGRPALSEDKMLLYRGGYTGEGFSGSPVIDLADGFVVGMLIHGEEYTEPRYLTIGIPSEKIQILLGGR